MRAFELLTPSARTVPPEVRTGWLSDLAGDAVVLHAMRGFRPMILGLLGLFAGLGLLFVALAVPGGHNSWVGIVFGAVFLGIAVLTIWYYSGILRGLPTVAVDRAGLHLIRGGMLPWSDMESFKLVPQQYGRTYLQIGRRQQPGERRRIRGRAVIVADRSVEIPTTDLIIVMAQYSAAARFGTPVEPPPMAGAAPAGSVAGTPSTLVTPVEVDKSSWPGPIEVIGGVLDPRTGTGLHQLQLDSLLASRPARTTYWLASDPLGIATASAIEALLGRDVPVAFNRSRRTTLLQRLALPVGIVVGLFVVGVVARPFTSSSAGNLGTGDCFDLPTTATDVVKDVQHHPCTDLHDAEVVGSWKYTAAAGSTYPTETEFDSFIEDKCLPAFEAYTGLAWDSQTTLEVRYYRPASDSWRSGGRDVVCFVVRADHARMSASVKTHT